MTSTLDQSTCNDLFTQLVEQGISLGYLEGISKTLDREWFLSKSFVRDEIKRYVTAKGRSSVQQLSGMLNVEHKLIYDAWSVLAPENDWTIVDDIVLAREYLDSLEEQVTAYIRENGIVSAVTCAQKFGLPFYYMLELLGKIVSQDQFVKFPQLPNIIMTIDYVETSREKISNMLKNAKEPFDVVQFQKSDFESEEELFNVLFVEQIHQSHGTVLKRGGKDIYVPDEYRDRQIELVRSLLNASGYIEYSTVEENYGYMAPKELLRQIEAGIILLDSCAVTKGKLETLVSAIQDDLDNQGWSNVTQHIPFILNTSDNATLQSICVSRLQDSASPRPRKKGANANAPFILDSEHIVTPNFLQSTMASLQAYINQRARQELQQEKKMHSARGKKKLNSEISAELAIKEVKNELVKTLQFGNDFASSIAQKITPSLSVLLTQAIRTVYALPTTNAATEDGAVLESHLKKEEMVIKDMSRKIFYTYKASRIFQDNDARKSLEKYILRQLGLELVYHLVLKALLERQGQVDEEAEKVDDDVKIRALIEEYLQQTASESSNLLRALYKSVSSDKRAEKFIQIMQEVVTDNWQDPDIQRETVENMQKTLHQQLVNTPVNAETAPSILHLSSIVCFQSLYHLSLFVSGKYVPHIIKQISLKLESETASLFNSCLETVMASRKQQGNLDLDLINRVRQWALLTCGPNE
ncbi:hypothetical protein VTP01DRAFT_525 [Rhizomucor pusillus]|uniref:uncharacterized protein n=1 Tax=Rhizomucor pusillus TaxID=4840 RepID=UPI003743CC60